MLGKTVLWDFLKAPQGIPMHRQFGNTELNPPPQVLKLKSRASRPPSGKVCITFPKTTTGSPAHRNADGGSRFHISTCLLHLPPCLKFFPVAAKLVQGVVTPTKCYRSARLCLSHANCRAPNQRTELSSSATPFIQGPPSTCPPPPRRARG